MGEIVQPGETEGHFYLLEATVRKKWYPISPRLWLLINPNCPNTFELDTLHLSLLNRMFFHFMSVMSQCLNANMSDMLEVTTKTARLLRMESVANQWLNGHGCYQAMGNKLPFRSGKRAPTCDVCMVPGSNPSKDAQRKGAKLRVFVCLFVCLFVFFFGGSWYVDILEGADLVDTMLLIQQLWAVFFQFFRSRK